MSTTRCIWNRDNASANPLQIDGIHFDLKIHFNSIFINCNSYVSFMIIQTGDHRLRMAAQAVVLSVIINTVWYRQKLRKEFTATSTVNNSKTLICKSCCDKFHLKWI